MDIEYVSNINKTDIRKSVLRTYGTMFYYVFFRNYKID